jgi:putative intracellular protease/amidase
VFASAVTVAERPDAVQCEMGMRVVPDHSYADAPAPDVVLVPGGSGPRREIANRATAGRLPSAAARCAWLTSVCTGSFLLAGTGLAAGRRVTTHHHFLDRLWALGGAEVVEGVRFIRDRNPSDRGRRDVGHRDVALAGRALYGTEVARGTKDCIASDHQPADRAELRRASAEAHHRHHPRQRDRQRDP